MAVATARQTLTITFDPSSLYAQTLVQTLRLSKLFKVEESPYDMRYVKMVESAEKGESHRISREQLWKLKDIINNTTKYNNNPIY